MTKYFSVFLIFGKLYASSDFIHLAVPRCPALPVPRDTLEKEGKPAMQLWRTQKSLSDFYKRVVTMKKSKGLIEGKYQPETAAYFGFLMLFEHLKGAALSGNISPSLKNLFLESIHHLGMIDLHAQGLQRAHQAFAYAASFGLKRSKHHLKLVKKTLLKRTPPAGVDLLEEVFCYHSKLTPFVKLIRDLAGKDLLSEAAYRDVLKTIEYRSVYRRFSGHMPEFSDVDDGFYQIFSRRTYTCTEVKAHSFKTETLQNLEALAREVYAQLQEGDLLISLGRSPSYVRLMLKALYPDVHILSIPFTGGKNINQVHYTGPAVSAPSIAGYIRYMQAQGLGPRFFEEGFYKRIVIFDRIESGNSVLNFKSFFPKADKRFQDFPIHIIGFSDERDFLPRGHVIPIFKKGFLDCICAKHFESYHLSLERAFFPDEWADWDQQGPLLRHDFSFTLSPIAKYRCQQIEDWARDMRTKI